MGAGWLYREGHRAPGNSYNGGMPANLYPGLISGTSADGIDAAPVEFDDANDARSTARLVFARTYPWQPELRAQLVELGRQSASGELDKIAEHAVSTGRAFADDALGARGRTGDVGGR